MLEEYLQAASIPFNSIFVILPLLLFVFDLSYRYLRRKFPVRVNCWFCNQYTSVNYNEKNSFTCSLCRQYNGFNEDGGYNKPIPEQHDELLNHIITPQKRSPSMTSNGLCIICNNNQQLKIYQLANFVPLNEDNFDLEIEHFQKQLEKAYKLCQVCNSTVKRAISKQNCSLLGKKIEEIRKSGKSLLNKSSTAKVIALQNRFAILCSTIALTILAIAYLYINNIDIQVLCSNWIELFLEYKRELGFAVSGSFITLLFTQLFKRQATNESLVVKKSIKQETTESVLSEFYNSSGADSRELSFSSFQSPLNSTTRSDEDSFCSELASPTRKGAQSVFSGRSSNLFIKNNSNQRAFSMSSRVCNPFDKKTELDLTFENLKLSTKKSTSIIAPSKFRNPWTGKPWEISEAAPSRSSSQSSGIYSHAPSVAEDDATFSAEQNLFKKSMQNYVNSCSFDNLSLTSRQQPVFDTQSQFGSSRDFDC